MYVKEFFLLKSAKLYTYLFLFDQNYSPPAVTPTSTGKDNKGQTEAAPNEYVILLADSMLMHMPLEALEFLQVENVTAMCRDFSLSLFHHRFYKDEATGEERERERVSNLHCHLLKFAFLQLFVWLWIHMYSHIYCCQGTHKIIHCFDVGNSWAICNLLSLCQFVFSG